MAILNIKKAGDKILKQICSPVDKIDKRVRILLDDMAETMYEANGCGLAAPQVGIPLRIILVDVGDGLIELINPVIVSREGVELDSEGCLSVPDIFGEVERYQKVIVEGLNRRGKKQRIVADKGMLSRALQHEMDHLDGVLFIDKARSLQRGN